MAFDGIEPINQSWDKSLLALYLSYDIWEADNALSVLCGVDYNDHAGTNCARKLERNQGEAPEGEEYQDFVFYLKSVNFYLRDVWKNSKHPNETIYLSGKRDDPFTLIYPPKYFIDWALSKRFRPDWLDWAIEKKLYTPKELRNLPAPTSSTPAAPEFDKAGPTYPPELAYALEAWRAVSATEGKGKPKARIKAWLDSNTKLSDKAKERIAVVANWEKLGGATSTE